MPEKLTAEDLELLKPLAKVLISLIVLHEFAASACVTDNLEKDSPEHALLTDAVKCIQKIINE